MSDWVRRFVERKSISSASDWVLSATLVSSLSVYWAIRRASVIIVVASFTSSICLNRRTISLSICLLNAAGELVTTGAGGGSAGMKALITRGVKSAQDI